MIARRTLIPIAVTLALAGCASAIEETPIAPNMVRLDVSSISSSAFDTALRRAAELTLANGYRAFRLTPLYAPTFHRFGFTVVMSNTLGYGAYDAMAVLGLGGPY